MSFPKLSCPTVLFPASDFSPPRYAWSTSDNWDTSPHVAQQLGWQSESEDLYGKGPQQGIDFYLTARIRMLPSFTYFYKAVPVEVMFNIRCAIPKLWPLGKPWTLKDGHLEGLTIKHQAEIGGQNPQKDMATTAACNPRLHPATGILPCWGFVKANQLPEVPVVDDYPPRN